MKNEPIQKVLHGITRNHDPPSDTTFQIVGNLNKKQMRTGAIPNKAPQSNNINIFIYAKLRFR